MSAQAEEYKTMAQAIEDALGNNLELYQEEKYIDSPIKGHCLKITSYLKDKTTGEKAEFHSYEIKLGKSVPRWLTKHNLWHHTDKQLAQLKQAMINKGEKKPSKETLDAWYKVLDMEKKDVLQTNNNSK